MRHATSEGGQFYQSMEKQSQTLNGQLSTLKDNTSQLLGLLTQGMSEDLRNNLLPMANNMVAELTEAFSADGIRGLVTAAGSMLPDLIGMLTGELKNGISGLQRWLPVGAKQLMGALPQAIRGAGEVIPQLTTVLFEFAGTAITELVAMLPELVPELLTGFGNMFESVWKGIDQLGASLIYGVERAMHGGREKVLGAWVEDSDFEWDIHVLPEVTVESVQEQIDEARQGIIDVLEGKEGVNASEIADKIISGDITGALHDTLVAAGVDPATAAEVAGDIQEAQDIVNGAFESLGISEEAQAKILEMQEAGASEGEIAQYIQSLGVDPNLAQEAAASITSAGELVTGAVDKLPEDVQTSVSGLNFLDAQDTITASFAVLEVPLAVASPIVASCMEVRDFISTQVAGIFDDIATVLTDGLPDSEEAIAGLEDKVRTWARDARGQIQEWYDQEVAKLNASGLEGAEYDQAMQQIQDRADVMFDEVAKTEAEAIGFIGNMAGQSTEYVKAHLGELDDIEKRCAEVSGQIDALGVKMNEVEANAFKVVRAGGAADETTIQGAMNYVVTEFKIDTQAAEDAYEQEVKRLNAEFSDDKIDIETRDQGVADAAAKRDAQLKAAEDAFNQNFFDLMAGIAEGEGVSDAFNRAMAAEGLRLDVGSLLENVKSTGELDPAAAENIAKQFSDAFGVAVTPEMITAAFGEGGYVGLEGAMNTWMSEVDFKVAPDVQKAFGGKVGQTFNAALESGFLSGTVFDTKVPQEQLGALFSASVTGAAEEAAPAAEEAGGSIVSSAVSGAGNSGIKGCGLGGDFGQGYANGILAKISAVKLAAQKLAQAANITVKTTQDSASPSKVARGLGNDFGEGYSIGIQESLANAAYVARRMTGGVISAAAEGQRMRVSNMPDLQQEIITANELSTQPIDLYVNGRLLARAMATDTRNEQNRYNRSIALGVGQK